VEVQSAKTGDSDFAPACQSSPVLTKILSTLVKRFKTTDEGLAIGNINSRTSHFDKHYEGAKSSSPPLTIKRIEEFNLDCEGEMNLTSGMLRLSLETSSSHQPSSYFINVVLVKVLLEGTDDILKVEAKEYLEKFLFLHLTSNKREEWLTLVLSACRLLEDQKSYRGFDLSNSLDLQSCWLFFSEAVSQILADCDSTALFLAVFVKILHRDFEFWWKHRRNKGDFPLLFYLLGGSESNLLHKMDRSVVKLYSASLENSSMSTPARKLMSMCGLLLAHQDSFYSQGSVNSGSKVEFAGLLASSLETAQLSPRGLYIELSLVQPPWLSGLASQALLSSLYNVPASDSLAVLLNSQTNQPAADSRRQFLLELSCHKVCSYQQTHNIFLTHWHHLTSPLKEFRVFKHMTRLEEEELRPLNKMVKYEAVAVKLSTVVENVNTITKFANNDIGHISAPLSSLFFKMARLDRF